MSDAPEFDSTFRVGFGRRNTALRVHRCGSLCPSCGWPCRIQWTTTPPRTRNRAARDRRYCSDEQGHLW